MKQLFFVFLAFGMFTILTSSVLGETDAFDFQNSNWGDSYQKVMESEKANTIINNPVLLICRSRFVNMDCIALFSFKHGRLQEGQYRFELQHNNDYEYIDDYNRAKNQLIKKYGLPFKSEDIWNDKTMENKEVNQETAIKKGYMMKLSLWQNERTRVRLVMYALSKITMGIGYMSIDTQPEPEE